jgi:hypothetical protein
MRLERLAPAKVNLFLHVGPLAADGYHSLVSLVTFADVGDVVALEPAPESDFVVEGPFGAGLAGETNNLVMRARDLLLAQINGAAAPFRLRRTDVLGRQACHRTGSGRNAQLSAAVSGPGRSVGEPHGPVAHRPRLRRL